MKACSYCGQSVKESCTVCPVCKRAITAPSADAFPELRSPKKKNTMDAEEEARLAKAAAERAEQEKLAPDHPEEELLSIGKQSYMEATSKKTLAAAAYTGILFFVPWYACRDKKYGAFHANQGLVVLIFLIIGVLLNSFIGASQLGRTLCFGYFGGLFYLMILGAIRGLRGKMIPLPIIGGISIIKAKPEKRKEA